MSNKKYLFILLAISITTHFAFFGHPNETVFDEVHFGKFISAYYTHEYYFDIHPPLGKLILAGFGKAFDFRPEFSFAQIGEKFPDNKYMALRFLPVLGGTLLPLVIFLLLMELRVSSMGAFFGGLFISIENALITQSHYILLDSFLLLFGFSSLLFYLKYKNSGVARNLVWMTILGSLSASIKWTGLSFLAVGFIAETIIIFQARDWHVKRLARILMFWAVIPLAIYFSIFAIHFSLLTKSGQGDAFMTPEFQKTLEGNSYSSDQSIGSINIIQKFIELNKEMYVSNQGLTATHPYGSQWYTWPLMIRPIYYWVHDNSRIYLIGNPVIWWASTVAVIYLLIGSMYHVTWNIWTKRGIMLRDSCYMILMSGYVINLLPFIGIKRVMFLYHYLTGLILAILMMVYLIDRSKNSKKYFIALTIAGTIAFIYFAPLTYGLSLSPKAYESRVWLESWR